MGLVLLGYAAYGLVGAGTMAVRRHWVAPSGILGGILATSTGLSGPAVAMYVHGRRVSARQQTATMSAYVGAISVLGLGLLALRGAVSGDDLQHVVRLAGGAVAGTLLGRWWASRQARHPRPVTLLALGVMGLWTWRGQCMWFRWRSPWPMTERKGGRRGAGPADRGHPDPGDDLRDDGALDLDGLASQVRFSLGPARTASSTPGVVSEFYTLTDEERRTAVETVVTAAAGRCRWRSGSPARAPRPRSTSPSTPARPGA